MEFSGSRVYCVPDFFQSERLYGICIYTHVHIGNKAVVIEIVTQYFRI